MSFSPGQVLRKGETSVPVTLSLFEKHSITGGCCIESGEAGDGNCERKTSQNWKEDVGSGSPTTSLLAGSPPTPELGLRLACLTRGSQRALCTQMCEAPRHVAAWPPAQAAPAHLLECSSRPTKPPAAFSCRLRRCSVLFPSTPVLLPSPRPGEPASWGAGASWHFYSASTEPCSPPVHSHSASQGCDWLACRCVISRAPAEVHPCRTSWPCLHTRTSMVLAFSREAQAGL